MGYQHQMGHQYSYSLHIYFALPFHVNPDPVGFFMARLFGFRDKSGFRHAQYSSYSPCRSMVIKLDYLGRLAYLIKQSNIPFYLQFLPKGAYFSLAILVGKRHSEILEVICSRRYFQFVVSSYASISLFLSLVFGGVGIWDGAPICGLNITFKYPFYSSF